MGRSGDFAGKTRDSTLGLGFSPSRSWYWKDMETMLITLGDKEIWDSYYVFEDRNKIQNKPKDLAQRYKVNINQHKYDILHLDLNISIS